MRVGKVCASFWLMFCLAMQAAGAPYRPDSADKVLLEVDRVSRPKALDQSDPAAALNLGRSYVAIGRAQNDERYFGYAAAVLRPWKTDRRASGDVLELLADIAQHQHHFADALEILNQLIRREEQNAHALLMRASLHMTQGRPQLAQIDCRKVLVLGDLFAGAVCSAQSAGLQGHLASSNELMVSLLDRSPTTRVNPVDIGKFSWALGVTAEMNTRMGDVAAAQRHLLQAIELSPQELPLRLQLCDVFIRAHRAGDAAALLAQSPPTEPVLLRRALIAQDIGGDQEKASALAQWRQAAAFSAQLGVRVHLRELARGQLDLLHDAKLATATALQNWRVQREPEDAQLLLRAARASGDGAATALVRNWQLSLKLEDAELRF